MADLDEEKEEPGLIEIEPFVVGVPGNPGADIGSPGDVLTYLGPNFVPRFRPVTGAGLGNVTGPATTTVDFVPQWNNTTGTLLKNGLPVSIAGAASSLVETDAGGKIAASVIPLTGVTPGTYNSANITVLADGRLSAASPGAAAGIGDAPAGPTVYGRNTGVWLPVVPLTGATMTGQLLLPAPAGPTSAATKGYVDTTVSGLAPIVSPNFTGVPTAPNQIPTDDSTRLATTHFVKSLGYGTVGSMSLTLVGDVAGSGSLAGPIPTTIANTVSPGTVSGITFNNRGLVVAATDQGYVTAASGAFVPSAGGTISGSAPGTLTINRAGTLPVTPTGVIPAIWLVSGAVENCSAVIDTFATSTSFMVRRANGTAAAPTRLNANDAFGQLAWRGFYGPTTANPGSPAGYGLTVARVEAMALEDFDQTHQGTQIQFRTTLPGATAMTVQANLGPGLTVGPAAAPAGGMLVGDVDGVRLFQNGQPIVTGAALSAALAGYLPLAGGTISGVAPGSLTINRNTVMPAAPAAAVLPLWMVAADTDLNPLFGMDAFGTQLGMMLRRANGTAAVPTRIVNNERLGNLAWRGYADTHYGLTSARIAASALEDYHDTAQGTQIIFETTAVGTIGVAPQVQIGPGLTVGSPTPPAGGMQIGDGNFSRVLLNGVPVTAVGGGGSGTITLTGDVTGSGTGTVATTVARLQLRPISTAAPLGGQVLGWNSTAAQWEPTPAVTGTGGPPGGSTGYVQINAGGAAFGGIVMTGDASWDTTTTALTLNPSVMSTPGTFQGITVNGKGLVTAATPMNYATTAALAGYLPLAGGTISGTPGSLTINRGATMPAVPALLTPAFWMISNTAENTSVVINSFGITTSWLQRRANGTAAAPTRLSNGDGIGQIAWRGYFGPTTAVPASPADYTLTIARMQASALEDFDNAHQATQVQIQTVPRGGSTTIGTVASFRSGMVVGAATGGTYADGDMGAGTVNAQFGFYVNGTLVGGGSGTPGGSAGQVQYNSAGTAFGGSPGILLSASSVTAMNIALSGDGVGDIYYRASTGALTRLGIGGSGNVLTVAAGLPSWQPLSAGSGTVSSGGVAGQVALYTATSTVAAFTMSGDAQISPTGALSINSGVVTYPKIQNVVNARLLGNNSGGGAPPSEIILGANLAWADATHIAATGSVSSVGMTVPAGSILGVTPATITGTGTFALTTAGNATGIPYFSSTSQLSSSGALAAHGVMIAGSPPVATSAGTLGYVLTSNGPTADPTFQPSGSGAGTVNSAAVNLVAWYPGPTTPQAVVGGHPNVSLLAGGGMVVNRNAFAPPAPVGSAGFQLNHADNEAGGITMDTHGAAVAPNIALRSTRGVTGSISQIIAGDGMGSLQWRGSDTTAYTPVVARVAVTAIDSFSATARGAQLELRTTTPLSLSEVIQAIIGPGLLVGPGGGIPALPSGGMVQGDLNALRIFENGIRIGIDSTATLAASAANPAIATQFVIVTPVAVGHGVTLSAAAQGVHCLVRNSGANTLNVFPPSGGIINIQAVNAPVTVLPNSTAYFEASAAQWFTVP